MLSTLRVTEDAAVSKMKKKKQFSSHEVDLQGRKTDNKRTSTYIIYTVLSVMKRNKTQIRHKGHIKMGVLVFIGGSEALFEKVILSRGLKKVKE